MIARAPHHAAAALLVLAACSGGAKHTKASGGGAATPVEVPTRADTAADSLLDKLPAGADALLEIDLGRVRKNRVVGAVATSLMRTGQGADTLRLAGGTLADVDLVVFASYGIGTQNSATLTLVRGDGVKAWRRGHRLDPRTMVLGTEAALGRVKRVATGAPSLATDKALLAVRTRAMPNKAASASVRVSARLSFDARVSLAGLLGLEEVPTSVSVWGDVVDDLAIVGLFGATNPKEAVRLTRAVTRWRNKLAREAGVRAAGLGFLIRRTVVERRGNATRALLVIGPKRLARYVSRFAGGGE